MIFVRFYQFRLQSDFFADDTKMYTVLSDSKMEQCLQTCLDSISRWSDRWQLTLSPTKCTVLHVWKKIGRPRDCSKYFIGNHALVLPTVTSDKTDFEVFPNSCITFVKSMLYFC